LPDKGAEDDDNGDDNDDNNWQPRAPAITLHAGLFP